MTLFEELQQAIIDGKAPVAKEVFDVVFDDQGKRLENVVFAPQTTLQLISMSPEDLDDIRHRLPFVLTSDEIPEYQIMYVGQQQQSTRASAPATAPRSSRGAGTSSACSQCSSRARAAPPSASYA